MKVPLGVVTIAALLPFVNGYCNEYACGSIVSKCMLTGACKCEINRHEDKCSCCKECTECLGNYYEFCCACLGLCDPDTYADISSSQVGDLPDPFPEAFRCFSQNNKFNTFTFQQKAPVELKNIDALDKTKYEVESNEVPVLYTSINCTTLYLSQCQSVKKCQVTCLQIGASAYRWFFDGCCQCVGENCINYGINENRCMECPEYELEKG